MFKKIKELVSDSLIYGMSGIISRFIGIFLIPFYTKVFTPSDYGSISIFSNAYTLITILLVFALDNSTARWFYDTDDANDRKKTINTWLWFYLTVSFFTMLVFYFCSDLISSRIKTINSNVSIIIKVLSINLVVVVFNAIANNILRFEKKALKTVTLAIIISLLTILFSIYFVLYLKIGILGVFVAQLLSSFIGSAISIFLIFKWIDFPNNYDFKRLLNMLNYSWPFIPASFAYWVVNLSGVYFINQFLNKTEVGLYQIGVSLAATLGLIINAFQQAWSPFAFSIMNHKDSKKTYSLIFDIYVIISLFCCVIIALFGLDILKILTNPKFYNSSKIASVLVYSYFFIGMVSIADLGLAISKKTKPLGFILFLSAIVTVVLNLILIPHFGILGAAFSICIAQMINPIYMFYKSQKYFYVSYNFKNSIILFLISIFFSSLSILYMEKFNFLSKIFFLTIYLSFIFFIYFKKINLALNKIKIYIRNAA